MLNPDDYCILFGTERHFLAAGHLCFCLWVLSVPHEYIGIFWVSTDDKNIVTHHLCSFQYLQKVNSRNALLAHPFRAQYAPLRGFSFDRMSRRLWQMTVFLQLLL